jgi:hypothetical protein
MLFSGAWGKMIEEKNLIKKSCDTLFLRPEPWGTEGKTGGGGEEEPLWKIKGGLGQTFFNPFLSPLYEVKYDTSDFDVLYLYFSESTLS